MCSEPKAFVAFSLIYGLYTVLCWFYPVGSTDTKAKIASDLADIREKIRQGNVMSLVWIAGYPIVYLVGLPALNRVLAIALSVAGLWVYAACGQISP